jgi:hypothetical protein
VCCSCANPLRRCVSCARRADRSCSVITSC